MSGSVSVGSLGPTKDLAHKVLAHKVLFELSEHLWCVWHLIQNVVSPLLPFCWGFFFFFFFLPLDKWYLFLVGSNILLLMAVQQCYSFAVLNGEDEHTSFYFTILCPNVLGWD